MPEASYVGAKQEDVIERGEGVERFKRDGNTASSYPLPTFPTSSPLCNTGNNSFSLPCNEAGGHPYLLLLVVLYFLASFSHSDVSSAYCCRPPSLLPLHYFAR
jgi:hypothetical protein